MCVDPLTASAFASVAMTAGQGVIAYKQGKAEEKAYKTAANQELLNSAIEETQYRKEARKFAANQRLQGLTSGGDVSSGSLSAVMDEDAATLELNALMRRYTGETRAEGLRFEGRSAARSGAITGGMKFMQAGVEALGSKALTDWDVFKKTKKPSGGTAHHASAKSGFGTL